MSVIGIDFTPAFEQGGGIGRYVRELITALARLDGQTDYRLFVAGASGEISRTPPGKNFRWKPTPITSSWLARIWYRAHLPVPVEVFTGSLNLYHATDFVLPPTRRRTSTLLTVHDLSFVRVPQSANAGLKSFLDRVVPLSVERADHVLADSQATKDDLVALYDVPPQKVTVLLCAVDAHFRRFSGDVLLTTRSKYRLGEQPYIFSIGTVQPRKNYARLIQALAWLRGHGYDLDLVIAGGRGWLEDPIYETVHTTRMENHVHFIGFADEADLPALYSGAECLAFPSLYEGFGFPVLEAMACGTPVVTSNLSSLPEVAGHAALLVNPYDLEAITFAIQSILDDAALRSQLIQKGYQQVVQFSWDKSADQLQQIYANLL